jgi:hypothetical protein
MPGQGSSVTRGKPRTGPRASRPTITVPRGRDLARPSKAAAATGLAVLAAMVTGLGLLLRSQAFALRAGRALQHS